MSDDTQVNQPKNDVQEAEVKQTQTDEKPTPTFNQEDVDRIVKQRLEAEKSKHQRMLDEAKKQEQELAREKEIQEAKTKADLENLMKQRIADKDKELADWKAKVKTINQQEYDEFIAIGNSLTKESDLEKYREFGEGIYLLLEPDVKTGDDF